RSRRLDRRTIERILRSGELPSQRRSRILKRMLAFLARSAHGGVTLAETRASARARAVIHGGCGLLPLEQAPGALVLLDVPAVLVVVFRDRQRTNIRAVRSPHTRTGHGSSRELHSRPAQLVELDLHSRQNTVELRDVLASAVVRGDRKDAEHFRVGTIGET